MEWSTFPDGMWRPFDTGQLMFFVTHSLIPTLACVDMQLASKGGNMCHHVETEVLSCRLAKKFCGGRHHMTFRVTDIHFWFPRHYMSVGSMAIAWSVKRFAWRDIMVQDTWKTKKSFDVIPHFWINIHSPQSAFSNWISTIGLIFMSELVLLPISCLSSSLWSVCVFILFERVHGIAWSQRSFGREWGGPSVVILVGSEWLEFPDFFLQ